MVKIRVILNARTLNVLEQEQEQSYIKSKLSFFLLRVYAISFPEAAILLVSDRDRDLWDNPFPDNRILVVVPTAQAQTSLENGV